MTELDPRTESAVFNRMTAYYDRYRPGYPEGIIRAVRDRIGSSADIHVLEIGAGSGKATAQFAPFGWEMLCLEPGKDLAAEGQRRFAGRNITFAASRLEEYPLPDRYFDAVISAQAFHWIEKPLGFRLCAAALKQNGWLMPFWNNTAHLPQRCGNPTIPGGSCASPRKSPEAGSLSVPKSYRKNGKKHTLLRSILDIF